MEPRTSVIKNRLEKIDNIISVASGKGGVGKSLVASTLALNLSKKGKKVGLLDLDLYGPSSHIILGLKKFDFPEEENGIIPPEIDGIKFMSIVIFTKDLPSAFRGIDITNIIIELLTITRWGKLDYLIIDMPPGIGDETLDVINLVKKSKFLVVTTPSKVAMGAVNKLLKMLKEQNLPMVGVLENMKMKKGDYVKNSVNELGIDYLGAIGFDENLEEAISEPKLLHDTNFMKDMDKIVNKIL